MIGTLVNVVAVIIGSLLGNLMGAVFLNEFAAQW
jgi:uncharacterized membrane protein YqgA involved in biofilm formation